MIRNSMYLSPNTRLIHKTNTHSDNWSLPPVTFVTSYETQEFGKTNILEFFKLIVFVCEKLIRVCFFQIARDTIIY
jgi:hypothetical protein